MRTASTLFIALSLLSAGSASAHEVLFGGYKFHATVDNHPIICDSIYGNDTEVVCRLKNHKDWPFQGQSLQFHAAAKDVTVYGYRFGQVDMLCHNRKGTVVLSCRPRVFTRM